MKKSTRKNLASAIGFGIVAAGLFVTFALNYGCITLAEDVARKINRSEKK